MKNKYLDIYPLLTPYNFVGFITNNTTKHRSMLYCGMPYNETGRAQTAYMIAVYRDRLDACDTQEEYDEIYLHLRGIVGRFYHGFESFDDLVKEGIPIESSEKQTKKRRKKHNIAKKNLP